MNRLAVGLAVGAGYVLGRTKKAKFAFAVGTMVAGRRMQLSPRALVATVTRQLESNPQFKEIGDQLREDLRGVGKAATGSLVNRQIEGLADRLHERTLGVQDRISGVLPGDAGEEAEQSAEPVDADTDTDTEDADQGPSGRDEGPRRPAERAAGKKKPPAPKSAAQQAAKPVAKATKPSARASAKPPAKKAPAKQSAPRKTAQKKTAAAARGTARRASSTARADRAKGGRDHG
ncbi:DNA primase [Streptomyces sp. NPDC052114]|uniref:DNA primase n=1 Tax=unclassified Streptomyces TaxID=2593676 RepID=UPI00343DB58A